MPPVHGTQRADDSAVPVDCRRCGFCARGCGRPCCMTADPDLARGSAGENAPRGRPQRWLPDRPGRPA
eukprot:5262844-Alexandrium_andersonii.AAC.1